MKRIFTAFLILAAISLRAQDSARVTAVSPEDSLTRGRFFGHIRYFSMFTHNQERLSDYYANAASVGVGYTSPSVKGWQAAMRMYSIANIGSSDLSKPDPVTGASNRYEIGLFDIQQPGSRQAFTRLEELYLQYSWKESKIRYGKMVLNTPFINPQDGRMRPTAAEGLWTEINPGKRLKLESGWLFRMSPRSTTGWYPVARSIGLYPVGLSRDGRPAQYRGNLQSRGVGLLGITARFPHTTVRVWNVLVENIMNTTLVQAEYRRPVFGADQYLLAGGQLIRQDGLGNGGNDDPDKSYFPRRGVSTGMSYRLEYTSGRFSTNINYSRITPQGKFLMPREWGREPLYTFLPRERNEGAGDVQAVSLNVQYQLKSGIKTALGIGQYRMPDVTDYSLNKYSIPSYRQFNADIRYAFRGVLSGMDLQVLYVYKQGTRNHYENLRSVINQVNMGNLNLVLNYRIPGSSEQ
jgi:hypothetical protein